MATSKTDPVSDLLNPADAELRGIDGQLATTDVREGVVPTRNTGTLDTDNIADTFGSHRFLGSENALHVPSNCPSMDNKGTSKEAAYYQNQDDVDEYIEWLHALLGAQPQEAVHFPTWFEKQTARLAQLEAAPTRRLTNEERLGLEQQLRVGPLVRACEMPTPVDEFMLAFALNTPAANLIYDRDLKLVVQMAVRMGMHCAQHNDPMHLVERYGVAGGPCFLFGALKCSRRPARVRLASIALAGAQRWYTNVGNSERQITLVHEVGDLEPRTNEAEQLEYLLMWPMDGATED